MINIHGALGTLLLIITCVLDIYAKIKVLGSFEDKWIGTIIIITGFSGLLLFGMGCIDVIR